MRRSAESAGPAVTTPKAQLVSRCLKYLKSIQQYRPSQTGACNDDVLWQYGQVGIAQIPRESTCTRRRTIRTSPTRWIAENSQHTGAGAGENPLERRDEQQHKCVAVYPASRKHTGLRGSDQGSASSVRDAAAERPRAATVCGGVARSPADPRAARRCKTIPPVPMPLLGRCDRCDARTSPGPASGRS